jgi:hypothetical protein
MWTSGRRVGLSKKANIENIGKRRQPLPACQMLGIFEKEFPNVTSTMWKSKIMGLGISMTL